LADGEVAGEAIVVGDAAPLVVTRSTTVKELVVGLADSLSTGKVVDGEAD